MVEDNSSEMGHDAAVHPIDDNTELNQEIMDTLSSDDSSEESDSDEESDIVLPNEFYMSENESENESETPQHRMTLAMNYIQQISNYDQRTVFNIIENVYNYIHHINSPQNLRQNVSQVR